jgi:ribosomal protein S12 methylthiotransferase accessory factor
MTVTAVGSGPAVEAIEAALADADRTVERVGPDAVAGDLAVVVGRAGARGFGVASERARAAGVDWLAVELGGVGGRAVEGIEATVTHLAGAPCYDCLRSRVEANVDAGAGGRDTDAPAERFAGALAGREALSRLAGRAPPGRLVEVPSATRELLPLPGCDCADERDWTPRRRTVDRSLDEALARAERALDTHVGVVSETGEAESVPLPYYLATVSDTTGFSDVRAATNAAGVAPDWDRAFMKALGEALERYAAGVYRAADLPATPGEGAVAPDAFVLPGDTGEPDAWVPGRALAEEAPASLPAERVFYPTDDATITTGLGLGNGPGNALAAGLSEVIERDAAMLSWYSTYEPLGLSVDDERFETVASRARIEGLSLTATLLTQDVDVPVVAVAAHREGEWPRFALGSAADFDVADAVVSAGCEALQNWTELRGMGRGDAADAEGAIGHSATLPDAVRAYTDPETAVPAGSVAGDRPSDPVGELVGRLSAAGLASYAARLTPRDLELLGLEAVRALVPEAQPLFVDEPYFGERAEQVPRELGYEPRLGRQHHPFP